jgi:hypothetical protein
VWADICVRDFGPDASIDFIGIRGRHYYEYDYWYWNNGWYYWATTHTVDASGFGGADVSAFDRAARY